MKPNPNRLKFLFPSGGVPGGISGSGPSGGSGGGGKGTIYTSDGQEDPRRRGPGGVPDFAMVKENVFATKYGDRNDNNQHVTKECIDQMMVGAAKYNKSKALGLVFTGGINAANGGGDVSDDTAYNAHHQGKLTEMVTGNDLEPKTGCEQMGFNVAKAADEAQNIKQHNEEVQKANQKKLESDKKKLMDLLGDVKSKSGDADME